MSKATSYNKGSKFTTDISNLSFIKLEDAFKMAEDAKAVSGYIKPFILTGMFINNKSKFGPRPFVSTPDFLVDLPSHMLDTVKEMLADEAVVDEINHGLVGFVVRTYFSNTYKKDCYSIKFVDLPTNIIKEPEFEPVQEELPF